MISQYPVRLSGWLGGKAYDVDLAPRANTTGWQLAKKMLTMPLEKLDLFAKL